MTTTVSDAFPQTPTNGQIAEVAAAAVVLRALRREKMSQLGYSLCILDEPGANPLREAHTRLDTAGRAACAMPKAANPLAFLLASISPSPAKKKPARRSPHPASRSQKPSAPPSSQKTAFASSNLCERSRVHEPKANP